jgi:hypothetical protein
MRQLVTIGMGVVLLVLMEGTMTYVPLKNKKVFKIELKK